ncbi:MAG: F0F1 ATP synthase subunit alpha [Thermomicrobiales bacterium]|nr:F0F1 ATP synthase subunit alpha [Thermomicrobiales bacterium]MCO5225229.1 F0F1 ATP synthase subunit alpha [Thermomicrobiales bacterium]
MAVRATEISDLLKQQIQGFSDTATVSNVGQVIAIGDGVATVHGLSQAMQSELVEFTKDGTYGLVLNLEEDAVSVIVMGEYTGIEEGDEVRTTGAIASVPVGEALLGRVVNALGQPIDGKGPIATEKTRPIERIAPGVIKRQDVDTPLQTGTKAIDAMTAIGRGQRQLILGDRQTGKTTVAIDAIINQRDSGVKCIYVAIGQRRAQVAQMVQILEDNGAMENTIVVVASASDPAPMQYIAPFAGTAMGEEFMEQGGDALVVYDDLSKHAQAYRQVSLLVRRPPGREAYPGDVFYLHSRLLERASRMSDELGGGSLTSLPIIETQAGDISAYIPTNVISITDGQIYLESDLFYAGVRPAINTGLSVSRVGGAAQVKGMKKVAGSLRLDMANYRSLAAFAQFGTSDLDASTRAQIERGRVMVEVLKQPQYSPLPVSEQIAILWAGANGFIDDVPVERVREFEAQFLETLRTSYSSVIGDLQEKKELTDEIVESLTKAIKEFKATNNSQADVA